MFIFGAGKLVAKQTQDANGAAIATPTPVRLGTMQEVQGDIKFDTKKLYGASQFPVAVGRGKGSLDFTAKTGEINGAVLGALVFGHTATTGQRGSVFDEAHSVPAVSTYTVTIAPPSSGTFVEDLGVVYASSGIALVRAATATAAGTYSVNESTGVYTFHSGDASAALLFSYDYTTSTGSGQTFTLTNDLMGQSPFFSVRLQQSYQGKNFNLYLPQCTSSNLSLPFKNEDFSISDFKFEAMANAAGIVGIASLF